MWLRRLGVTALAMGLLLYAPAQTCAQGGCGFEPIKPLVPFGCKDLRARCQCQRDAEGFMVCAWVWECIPEGESFHARQ